jgi:transcriptional regulator GlxA family with amidase domain
MKRVIIVAVPPTNELDVIGPVSAFAKADELLRASRKGGAYQVEVVSAGRSRNIPGDAGVGLIAASCYRELTGPVDTLLVAGGPGARAGCSPDFMTWLRKRAARTRRVGSVCTGAFVLAQAGLLNGRRAATHWAHATELGRRFPDVTVDADSIWLRDGGIVTSAGICAGIDLALALVEEDYGAELALRVARELVVYLRRPGGQSQFSVALAAQKTERRALRDLIVWIGQNLREDLRVPALAERVNMSERNFVRVFSKEVGTSPGRYADTARTEAARQRLETTDDSIDEVAEWCGYKSREVLRRAFVRIVGTTPADYRRRFRIAS